MKMEKFMGLMSKMPDTDKRKAFCFCRLGILLCFLILGLLYVLPFSYITIPAFFCINIYAFVKQVRNL